MKNNYKNYQNKESGQSMVELAVSIVVLLILLAGVVDIGRIAFYYIAMRDAAQEGASYGSIFPNECEEIVKRVEAGSVDSSRIQVDLKISGEVCEPCAHIYIPGEPIEVTITDPNFPITMPILGTFLGRQSIVLETTIKNSIVLVPDCEP